MKKSIEARRAEIAGLKDQLSEIKRAPCDAQTIASEIRAVVHRHRAKFDSLIADTARIAARQPARADIFFEDYAADPGRWAAQVLAGIACAQIEDALIARAISASDQAGGALSPADRAEKLRAASRTLYELERADVEASLAEGIPLRPDTNGAAWLGAPLEAAEAANLI